MIKITFEVSEDFIEKGTDPKKVASQMMVEGNHPMQVMLDMIGFGQLKKQIEKGKTEFVVTPDKLDEKSLEIYNHEIGEICLLAAFSESDKKESDTIE